MANGSSTEQRLQRIISVQSAVVQAELDLDRFMQRVVDTVAELTGATGAVVELVDGEEMVYRSATANLAVHAGLRLKRANSLSGLCVALATVLRCDDSDADPRVDAGACRQVGVRSMICAPLFRFGIAVGVLKIMSDRPHAFTDDDSQSLQLLAGLLGTELGKQLAFDALQQAETRLRLLLEHARSAIISIDGEQRVLRWNHAAEQLFHCSAGDAIGQSLSALRSRHGEPLQLDVLFARLLQNPSDLLAATRQESDLGDGAGGRIVVEYSFSDLHFGPSREVTAFIADITARRDMELALRDMAETDALTGLANRRHFLTQLGKALSRADRQRTGLALFYLDMNDFKAINDHYGHEFGDRALQEFSRRLHACVRESDEVGRLGGDEFVVLAEGIDSEAQALVLAEKLARALDAPMPGCEFRLQASIGISFGRPGVDARQLLNEADGAMYQAKRQKAENSVAVLASQIES